jgi:hypothetical protein
MKVLCLLLAVGTLTVFARASVAACTVVDQSQDENDLSADLIFTGTAIRADYPGWLTSTGAEVIWTFKVDGVEKGRQRERIKVASALEEASCGYEFQLGERYRVLASKNAYWSAPYTGYGSGNQDMEPLAQAPTVEGSFYAVNLTLSLPLAVLIGGPVLVGALLLLALVLVGRGLISRVRRRPTT